MESTRMHTLFDTVPRLHSHTLDIFVLGTALLLGTALYVTRKDKLRRRGLPYPPGPPGLPLIGNVFDMPSAYEWIVYRDWSRKYNSAVVHVSMPGTHLVVVNSAKAANDLFDKRSSIYSDRPSLTSLTEYLGFDWTIGSIPYSAKWRSARRGFHAHFHPSAARAYEPLETAAAHELLRNLLESPENFLQHTRHTAGKVILRIAYGIEALPQNDPFVALAEQAVHSIALGTKLGGRIFDLVPILKRMPWWVPGAGFKREALKWRPIVRRMVEEPFSFTRAAVDKGSAPFSVAANIINQGILDPELRAPKELPANIYVGGTDTTVTAFQTFILAMVLYPEAQRKAQAEIDAVIGSSRLPTFADEKDLPYVGALAKEIQRWHPVVPLAIPHRLTEDDVYEGCFIPAGTTVIGNAWAILHDPALFPDPESFKPEHFLPAEEGGTFTASAGRYTESAFGFGRRECPGRYMARASVWIAAATVLAAFDISPARDEQGNIIPAEEKYTSGFITHPEPFKCTIKPRSQAARELILATADEWA